MENHHDIAFVADHVDLLPAGTGKVNLLPYVRLQSPRSLSDGSTHITAFSPDPYLSSTLSYITIRGMQESGLITCAKHYVLYEQEPVCTGPVVDGMRTDCHHVNSIVDGESNLTHRARRASHWRSTGSLADVPDKTMKELYLPSFVESVRAGTGAVMWYVYLDIHLSATCWVVLTCSSSYNLINGTQSCENDQSMNRILKDELGFQGL